MSGYQWQDQNNCRRLHVNLRELACAGIPCRIVCTPTSFSMDRDKVGRACQRRSTFDVRPAQYLGDQFAETSPIAATIALNMQWSPYRFRPCSFSDGDSFLFIMRLLRC